MANNNSKDQILGPFIGHVTSTTAKLWVHWQSINERKVVFSIHKNENSSAINSKTVIVTANTLWVAIAEFDSLDPDSTYFYTVVDTDGNNLLAQSEGLTQADLNFKTLPDTLVLNKRLDFLLLSCHNPEAGKSNTNPAADGFEVWKQIPAILEKNPNVRFAILGGDQVYLDDAAKNIGQNPEKRLEAILTAYRTHWSNLHYRKVLCCLPAYLIWDDHDIIDGWGSERKAFEGDTPKPRADWLEWFESAKLAFWNMQAIRNPDVFGNGKNGPFDSCIRIGTSGIILADLRSNRNYRLEQIWPKEQFECVTAWVKKQEGLDTLFFVSPVVFAHGDPKSEEATGKIWPLLMALIDCFRKAAKFTKWINKWDKSIGDLRDDLDDAWFSKPNRKTAAKVLDYFFNLQNPKDGDGINVVILSGDIHTSGYSNIYSDDSKHGDCAVIPHIVSSPVSYSPFLWVFEAFFRSKTKTVRLSEESSFKAQISHHFAHRCATVISLRKSVGSEKLLKVKYYLEGFEEPTTVTFDLERKSRRENLSWVTDESQVRSINS